ncbi:MAG TPA: CHAD domain-containing protein, partial [Candidatus Solibacter sp.]|nr:CHAD domain-containing protein [Candidatus Solibacter sp.]
DTGNPQVSPLDQATSDLLDLSADVPEHQNIKPRLLHELRISLKRIRYTAELAQKSAGREQFLENLKSVQDAVGEWHDWESLVKTAEKQFGDRVNCPLLVEMRSLFAAKYSAANSAVANLFVPVTAVANKKQPGSVSSLPGAARLA